MRDKKLTAWILFLTIVSTPSVSPASEKNEQLFIDANSAFLSRDYEKAEAIFRKLTKISPNDSTTYLKLVNALSSQGKLESEIINYSAKLKDNPNASHLYVELGFIHYINGDKYKARNLFYQALNIDNNLASAYVGLAIIYQDIDKSKAIKMVNLSLNYYPNSPSAYLTLGNIYSEDGNLSEAKASYQKAIELKENYAVAYNNLGLIYLKEEKYDKSIKTFKKVLEYDQQISIPSTSHALAYVNLGLVYLKKEDYKKSAVAYQAAYKIDPRSRTALLGLQKARNQLAKQNKIPLNQDQLPISTLSKKTTDPKLESLLGIVHIMHKDGYTLGAGWIFKKENHSAYILTNSHVILDENNDEYKNIKINFFQEVPEKKRDVFQAKIIKYDKKNSLDLAVLKVDNVPTEVNSLVMKPGRVSLNTPVFIIGHPVIYSSLWNSVTGEVTNFSSFRDEFSIKASSSAGNSGSPVLNKTNKVIAMVFSIRTSTDLNPNRKISDPVFDNFPSKTDSEGIVFAYRIETIVKQLKEWNLL